jgi:hypothetical protein
MCQMTNYKLQKIYNNQITNSKNEVFSSGLDFVICDFFGIWDLSFGSL